VDGLGVIWFTTCMVTEKVYPKRKDSLSLGLEALLHKPKTKGAKEGHRKKKS